MSRTYSISILFLSLLTVANSLVTNSKAIKFNNVHSQMLNHQSNLSANTFLTVHLKDEIYSEENLQRLMLYIHNLDELENDQYAINDTLKYVALGRHQTAIYNAPLMHRYDTLTELIRSGGPKVSQDVCLSQIKQMIDRYTLAKSGSPQDLSIRLLMDTYGRVPAGVRGGYITWAGRYLDCMNFKLSVDGSAIKQEMRYCLASMKNPNWSSVGTIDEVLAVETAVCLPKSCDSLDYLEKYKLIEQLIHLNDGEFVARGLNISSLYCLPDEQSELRQWWKSTTTVVFIGFSTVWIFSIILATFIQQRKDRRKEDEINLPVLAKQQQTTNSINSRILSALSISENFNILMSTTQAAQSEQQGSSSSSEGNNNQQLKLDLRSIDGIKAICMFYVIMGHTLTCFSLLLKNAQDHFVSTSLANFIPYLVPIFAVNGFFVISGLLTSYIIFRENRSKSFLDKPHNWLFLVIYRYLRVMPMYLIVALFSKHVAKYLGSGPFWDYGTSSLASRSLYERESISWVLLFGANFKFVFDHCVVPAWYLANDFQFFLVTPIFISILNRSAKFGQIFIYVCIALGCIANSIALMSYDVDFRPIVQFATQSLMYQSANMNIVYTSPFFRIPSYLMGLLIGYNLYKFGEAKLRAESQDNNGEFEQRGPHWSKSFSKYGPILGVMMILMHCMLPVISSRIAFSKLTAKLFVATMMPTGHLMFAWAIGSYVLLAATGFGIKPLNQLLNFPYWKPLARLSLCTLLIQMEVIQYIVQTTTEMLDFNATTFASLTIFCAIISYLAATILYLLFEAPIRNLLSVFISHVTSLQQSDKQDDKN